MSQDNTLSFIVGAAVGGIAGYFFFKHQDQIVDKIHELEENLHIDPNAIIDKAKNKLDSLTQSVQSTIERYSSSGNDEKSTDEITSIMAELAKLRDEVRELSAR